MVKMGPPQSLLCGANWRDNVNAIHNFGYTED